MKNVFLIFGFVGLLFTSSADAGHVGGPHRTEFRVQGGMQVTFTDVVLERGKAAQLRVNGDGDTDLDCFVYDDDKNLIMKDDDDTDYCILDFVPPTTSRYYVVVKNLGEVFNDAVFWTN